MSSIKLITYDSILTSVDVFHFGWHQDEIAKQANKYQAKFFGSLDDACFEIIDQLGSIYYAVFRTAAEDEWFVKRAKDYLLFKDQNRVILNIGGKLYRYLIEEKEVQNNSCYDGIICNAFGKVNSPYFHSITSPNHDLMVIVDREGIAAIDWNHILWKHQFEWSDCGHLELQSVDDTHVNAVYEDCFEGNIYSISFNLQNGKYKMTPLKSGLDTSNSTLSQ